MSLLEVAPRASTALSEQHGWSKEEGPLPADPTGKWMQLVVLVGTRTNRSGAPP
jgi:hypothetical protein